MRKVKKTKAPQKFSFRTFLHRVWISFWTVAIVCFLGFNIWGYYSGFWANKWEKLTQSVHSGLIDAGFTLNEILITGRNRTSMEEVCNIFDIPKETCIHSNVPKNVLITSLDIQKIQEKFKALPWVRDVTIRRQLPYILHITLTERTPIALWQKNKQYYPLDEEGNVVYADCPECAQDMLLIVGNNAPKNTPELIKTLNKHEYIYNRIQSAKWVDNRRWNLYVDDLENGKVVLLPDSDLDESLSRLETLQGKHGVLDKQIKSLDLRFDDRTVIETTGKESITSLKKEEK